MMHRLAALFLFGAALPVSGQNPPPRLQPIKSAPQLESLDFATGGSFDVVKSGCVVLFDAIDKRIVCIDPASGRSVGVGREGAGPGEFKFVTSLLALRDGGMVAYDDGNARLAWISGTWQVTRTAPSPSLFGLFEEELGSLSALTFPSSTAATVTTLWPEARAGFRFRPVDVDSTGKFIDPAIPTRPFVRGMLRLRNGSWVIPALDENILFLANKNGIRLHTFGRPELRRELPDAEERARIEAQFSANTTGQPADVKQAVRKMYDKRLTSLKPAIVGSALAEDRLGRIWVGTTRLRAGSSEIDVYGADRRYLATVRIVGAVFCLRIIGDTLFALTERISGPEEGNVGVLRFRIQ